MPKAKNAATGVDVHQSLTNQIIAAIEQGPGEFRMPWHRSANSIMRPVNIASGKPYNGINILALWAAADAKGYTSGRWGTYAQWGLAGAQVCKGERASTIVFYKQFEANAAEPDDEERRTRMFARASSVFAAEQVEGYTPPETPEAAQFDPIEAAEAFVAGSGAAVSYGGERAYYSRAADTIRLPPRAAFHGTETSTPAESFYSTLLHELGHWSGAENRLNREFGKRFGDNAYAVEELVAELTAAFLCAQLGISLDPRPDHAQYLAHWLKVMKADNRALFIAASKASTAVRFLEEMQPRRLSQNSPPASLAAQTI